MKATELRIGNLVMAICNCPCHDKETTMMHFIACCSQPKTIGIIDAISNDTKLLGQFVLVNDQRYKLSNIKPVLLTKERMQQLGFREIKNETVKDCWYWADKEIREEDLKDEMFYFIVDYEGTELNNFANAWYFNDRILNMPDVSFSYVHEIQNFYFALTKEEFNTDKLLASKNTEE